MKFRFFAVVVSFLGFACSSGQTPAQPQAQPVQPAPQAQTANLLSPHSGLFIMMSPGNIIDLRNGSGVRVFSVPFEEVAVNGRDNSLIKVSSELLAYENQRDQTLRLINKLGQQVFSVSIEGLAHIEVMGNFLSYTVGSEANERFKVVNNLGREILSLDRTFEAIEVKSTYVKYEDHDRIYIVDINGREILNQIKATVVSEENDRQRYVDHVYFDTFYAFVENTGTPELGHQVHVRNAERELFVQSRLTNRPRFSNSLILSIEGAESGEEILHLRNSQGVEIMNRPAAEVTDIEVSEFLLYTLEGVRHLIGMNGVEIPNVNFDNLEEGGAFVRFVDEATSPRIHVYHTSGREVLNRLVSEVNIVGRRFQMSQNFLGYYDTSRIPSLHIVNSAGEEVLSSDRIVFNFDLY